MASEMLEKILEAEKNVDEKLERAKNQAKQLVDDANARASEIIDSAKKTATLDREKTLDVCRKDADELVSKKRQEALKSSLELKDSALSKIDRCAEILEKKLFS